MDDKGDERRSGRFDLRAIAEGFPERATTMLVDRYLTREESASARVFRVYRATPPHFHRGCDEYLYVLSGRGRFWMERAEDVAEFGPGELLFFRRGTVHALPEILEEPLVFLSIDTPPREPQDVIFVDPAEGTPESFIQEQGRATN